MGKLKLWDDWTFQQDNDNKHTSKSIKAFFWDRSWNVLWWPSQSGLNPTENPWWDLEKAVVACNPRNINKLEASVPEESWAKFPVERCQKHVSTKWNHLLKVIKV